MKTNSICQLTRRLLTLILLAATIGCGGDLPSSGLEPFESAEASEEEQEGTELVLELTEIKNSKGLLRIYLYDDEAAWKEMEPRKAHRRLVEQVPEDRPVKLKIKGLEPGTYAVFIHHDLDKDGELDSNVFRIPTEGLACSNQARGGLFGGPPWKKAKFEIPDEEKHTIKVRVAYPAGD